VIAYVVTGPAGAGKTTLGRELARATRAPLLDLDVLTNPLLDAVFAEAGFSGHWNDTEHRGWVRPARYAALSVVAADQVQLGNDVVLVAPFTAERRGAEEWDLLVSALVPADVRLVWLEVPANVLAERVRTRGEERDRSGSTVDDVVPLVPHVRVDGTLPTADQVAQVLSRSA
jgi:sugar-phosphatase